jgi:hypothetical protein
MKTGKMVDLPAVAPNAKLYRIFFRPDGGMVVQTRTGAKYAFVLLRPDGSTIASFPDTQEQGSAGRQLVACRP